MARNSEMLRFILRRVLGALPLLVGVGVFTFILVRVLPGDPAAYYATGPMATQDEIAQVRSSLGLDPVISSGGVPGVRNPITFSETPPAYELPPPGLDEHGEEIRRWLTS